MTGFFVTGTDTEVGKTFTTCAIIHALKQKGITVNGFKPVASGTRAFPGDEHEHQGERGGERGGEYNEDAMALYHALGGTTDIKTINPFTFSEAIAPHIAARNEGISPKVSDLVQHFERHFAQTMTLVEGAGGWLVPLNEEESLADLAVALKLPVLLVVDIKLGCINHALLSAAHIHSMQLPLAGWIANQRYSSAYASENIAAIQSRLDAPLLASLSHCNTPQEAAQHLDVDSLLRAARLVGLTHTDKGL